MVQVGSKTSAMLQLRPAGQPFEEMVDPVALFVFIRHFGQRFHQLPVARRWAA